MNRALPYLVIFSSLLFASSAIAEQPLKPLKNEDALLLLSGNKYSACEETKPSNVGIPARTAEQIRCNFDKNGRSLNYIYQNAIAKRGAIDGSIKLQLTIEPSGVVSDVIEVSSSIKDHDLGNEMIEAIKTFRFPSQNVSQWVGMHDLNFFSN